MIFAKTSKSSTSADASPQVTKPADARVVKYDQYFDPKRLLATNNIHARVRGFTAAGADVSDVSVSLTCWLRCDETAADVLPTWVKIGSKVTTILKDVLTTFKIPSNADGPAIFLQVEDATGTNLDHLEIWMAAGGVASP